MKNLEFPIHGTKTSGQKSPKFNINSPAERKEYFEFKAGKEIEALKKYLSENSFIAYMLGKKNSGKGTYAKLFTEIFGEDRVAHISIGDVVRDVHKELETKEGRKKVEDYLNNRYRGYISVSDGIDAILGRSTDKVSVPNEIMLSLIEREIDKHRGKALFIDGFPRTLDQVSYSLYFRDLMGYREDPDFFVLIDIPESVIDARIKSRAVCPICKISRNFKLFPTSIITHQEDTKEFSLICDNKSCSGYGKEKLVGKEGDDLGIEPIRGRLMDDETILKTAFALHGVPKVVLRNHIPVTEVKKYFDEYELTPEYSYRWDKKAEKVEVLEKAWTVRDDNGEECNSLLPAPVVTAMIKQIAKVLNIV